MKRVPPEAPIRRVVVICAGGTRRGSRRAAGRHEPIQLATFTSQPTVWETWFLDGPHVRHELIAHNEDALHEIEQSPRPAAPWAIAGIANDRYIITCPSCLVRLDLVDLLHRRRHETFQKLSDLADSESTRGVSCLDLSQLGAILTR